MKDDLSMIFQKALATAKTKDAYETKILEVEQAVYDITSKTEELKGLVHRHKHNRIDRRLPIGLAVLAGGIILTLAIATSVVNNEMVTEEIIATSLFTAPAYIAAGLLLGFFFRSLGKHKKLTVKYEAELAAHEEAAPRLLAEHQSRLDDLTNKAKAFWAEEKENLAMFPPEHKNLNSVTVIAEYARNLNIDNINTATAFGELVLTNRALSADVQKIHEEIKLINASVDKLRSDTEAAKKSSNSIWGAVILHTVLESIFDS